MNIATDQIFRGNPQSWASSSSGSCPSLPHVHAGVALSES